MFIRTNNKPYTISDVINQKIDQEMDIDGLDIDDEHDITDHILNSGSQHISEDDLRTLSKRINNYRFLEKTNENLYQITGVNHALFKTKESAFEYAKENKIPLVLEENLPSDNQRRFDYLVNLSGGNIIKESNGEYKSKLTAVLYYGWLLGHQFKEK